MIASLEGWSAMAGAYLRSCLTIGGCDRLFSAIDSRGGISLRHDSVIHDR